MSIMIDIISQKKALSLQTNNKLLHTINKRILWMTHTKPILKLYKQKDLSYNKIEEFIYFLQLSKFKYNTLGYIVRYSVDEYFRTLLIEDTDYRLEINIYNKDKSVEADYLVKSSDTRYNCNIYDVENYKYKNKDYYITGHPDNIQKIEIPTDNESYYVNPLYTVINLIINDAMYSLIKDYVLRDWE